jgi:hypothetical protein
MDWAKALVGIFEVMGKQGAFALGSLFGFILTGSTFWLAGKDTRARMTLDRQRENELFEQLKQKDTRINDLLKELERLSRGTANKKK